MKVTEHPGGLMFKIGEIVIISRPFPQNLHLKGLVGHVKDINEKGDVNVEIPQEIRLYFEQEELESLVNRREPEQNRF